jgi:hypothetical protein
MQRPEQELQLRQEYISQVIGNIYRDLPTLSICQHTDPCRRWSQSGKYFVVFLSHIAELN